MRRTKSLKRTKKLKRHPFHPIACENECGDKEKAMKQFAALLRKDNQPVRYLVVDDSVFARKNLIKMIEMFGGEVAGEAGGGVRDSPVRAQRRSQRRWLAGGDGRRAALMRMELIQPFINAADAVFAESLQAPTKIVDLSMDEDTYRRKGVAALIAIKGDIEGRVILDLSPEVAMKVASVLAGTEVEASD